MIKAILAVDSKFGIGKDGTLPWPVNKEDLKQFKDKTSGHIIVMGSKTWDDPFFPGPLKNRYNVVISSNPNKYLEEGADLVISINIKSNILEIDKNSDRDVWIIGGASMIDYCKDIVDEWHISHFNDDYKCDRFIELPPDLVMTSETITNENNFKIYENKQK